MKIGELSKRTGLGKDGIRHYETLGLIQSHPVPAGSRSYRDYPESMVERIELVRCGQQAGFTLKEMVPLLPLFVAGQLQGETQQQLLAQKLAQLEQKQHAINQMIDYLKQGLEPD